MKKTASKQNIHIAMFPFMSKGHTIPLLHLAKLIHSHRPHATFTIFTTPGNEPFITSSLSSLPSTTFTTVCLPFPTTTDIPAGVESTDQLPSFSLFFPFAFATQELQPHFENALQNLQEQGKQPVSFLISDGFLYWTQYSATKFNIRRLVFFGINMYATALSQIIFQNQLLSKDMSPDELIHVPDFPWIKVRKDDFDSIHCECGPEDPRFDFFIKCGISMSNSYCMVVNSFYELEQTFVDYLNLKSQLKYWCVGPLCLVDKLTLNTSEKPSWIIEWLNKKLVDEEKHVLYIAFGTQADLSNEQLKEITIGLEKAGVDFLWALRVKPKQEEFIQEFEERVKDRGLVVRSWVDQRGILEHESVQGFLSHCGWNSVIESICASVPILAWPLIAEQYLNVKMVVEQIQVGLRVETCDGSPRGFVKWEGLCKMVRELMEGNMGIKARKKVNVLSQVAKKCVQERGSSWNNLNHLLNDLEMDQSKISTI